MLPLLRYHHFGGGLTAKEDTFQVESIIASQIPRSSPGREILVAGMVPPALFTRISKRTKRLHRFLYHLFDLNSLANICLHGQGFFCRGFVLHVLLLQP